MKIEVALAATCAAAFAASAQDAAPSEPAFLQMTGEWRSHAVRAEPASLLDDPQYAAPFHILGRRAEDRDVIFFTAGQLVDGRDQGGHVIHAYDERANKTFGLVAFEAGVLRVEVEHGDGEDVARFYDAAGDLVSTEWLSWASPDRLESMSEYELGETVARVWYVTERVQEGASE